MAKKEFDIDDLSKNMFMATLNEALRKYDGSVLKLSAELDLKAHCYSWFKGHMPPYARMQEMYTKLLAIIAEKEKK